MRLLTVSTLLCAMLALTAAAALPEDKAASDQQAERHLVKRSASCSGGWSEFNGRCFRYIPRPMTWAKAEKNCLSMGGNLASVHDITEYHELQRLIKAVSFEDKPAWIGGSDGQEENQWFWSDGSRFSYSHWCDNEPNNVGGKEHCVEMNFSDQNCWNDIYCSLKKPFVCAKKI